jgi:hypothetical protein
MKNFMVASVARWDSTHYYHCKTMTELRIGTVDVPARIERERYFTELSYLELGALFAGPLKPGVLQKWKQLAPEGAIGLIAPWVLTQRKPPVTQKSWDHDNTVGDFRDSVHGRAAIVQLRAAVDLVKAGEVVFRSPPLFAPSAANRDQLKKFFAEIATEEAIGAKRVWIPDGLWEPRTAVKVATELGVTCAIDPLIVDPENPSALDGLEAAAYYVRVEGLGRAGALSTERLEAVLDFVEVYGEDAAITLVFASPERWKDARNFKKLLEEAAE